MFYGVRRCFDLFGRRRDCALIFSSGEDRTVWSDEIHFISEYDVDEQISSAYTKNNIRILFAVVFGQI